MCVRTNFEGRVRIKIIKLKINFMLKLDVLFSFLLFYPSRILEIKPFAILHFFWQGNTIISDFIFLQRVFC